MTRILVIGEAPSKWMAENRVDTPLVLARRELAALAGLIPQRFDELFECINVLDEWPGRDQGASGDRFPLDQARVAVAKMQALTDRRRVVLLGRRVERAFGNKELPWFKWMIRVIPGVHFMNYSVAPHPSHTSRWWNDASNRRAAAVFWGDLARAKVETR